MLAVSLCEVPTHRRASPLLRAATAGFLRHELRYMSHHDSEQTHPPVSSAAAARGGRLDVPVVDRRGFLTAAGASTLGALLLAACGSDDASPVGPGGPGGPSGLPPGVEVVGNTLRVNLAVATALGAENGFLIVSQPPTIMVNTGSNSFRAFTAVCTHSGCLVGSFANGRISCPCHGSQFNLDGDVVTGPAASPLRTFPTAFDTGSGTLTVTTT